MKSDVIQGRYFDTIYRIQVAINIDAEKAQVYIDDVEQPGKFITPQDEKNEHTVLIKINQQHFYPQQ